MIDGKNREQKYGTIGFVPVMIGMEAAMNTAMLHAMMMKHEPVFIVAGAPNSGKSNFMEDITRNFLVRQFTAEMLKPIHPWLYWDRIPRKYKKELKKKGLL